MAGIKLLMASACQSQSSFWEERTTSNCSGSNSQGSSPQEWRWKKKLTSSEVPRGLASIYHHHLSHPFFWRNIWSQQWHKFKHRGKCGFWDNAVAWHTDRLTGADSLRSPLSLKGSSPLLSYFSHQPWSLHRQRHREVSARPIGPRVVMHAS